LNVLPYDLGVQLGAQWEQQSTSLQLTGNLRESEARGLILIGHVRRFPPVRLAFAWTRSNRVPLILGQFNFFVQFDVCFFRSQYAFQIQARGTARENTGSVLGT
jgi:hypothetical protein